MGDRLHLSDEFVKDGVSNLLILTHPLPARHLSAFTARVHDTPVMPVSRDSSQTKFDPGKAISSALSPHPSSASDIIAASRRRTPNQRRRLNGIQRLFSLGPKKKRQPAYRPTTDKQPDGPACRIYGSVRVKKVTANLHITTLGHGYMSFEHTDHQLMNLSHVVHEFSFGPFFPAISQPLDLTYSQTEEREWILAVQTALGGLQLGLC